jgi:predicted molibdopterin-dependent oxidoreductase YjgC
VFGDDLIGSSSRNGALAEVTRNLDLLVVQDIYLTRTAELAHVVLPMPAPAETDGTYINSERRLQRLTAVGPSPTAKNALDVLGQLGQALGQAIYAGNLNSLWKEMEAAIPYLRKVNLADLGLAGVMLANGFTQERLMVPSPISRVEGLEFQYFSDIMLRRWKNLLREVL